MIGEAVKHMSASLKSSHTTIPWKQIAGMRDRLIHDYFGVDLNLVWDVVASELPQLERKTNQILDHPDKPTEPNS
ncbi:MAG: HepT-like ribonuclease domain-containing protein [Nitrospirales bacterium]